MNFKNRWEGRKKNCGDEEKEWKGKKSQHLQSLRT